jgi:hypothetical protein
MKLLLTAVLATVLVTPCMAASENKDADHSATEKPGVNEQVVPDTLKRGADQRIRTEGRASEKDKAPAATMAPPIEEKKETK